MSKSIYHPNEPHSIERLASHPSYEMLSIAYRGTNDENISLFWLLSPLADRVMKNPERYRDGIDTKDFIEEFKTPEEADAVMQELHRMNIYRITQGPNGSRLTPCGAIQSAAVNRAGSKQQVFYMPLEMIAWFQAEAKERCTSMSKLLVEVVGAYRGEPALV